MTSANRPHGRRPTPHCEPTSLWLLMQHIEACRHRAVQADDKAKQGSAAFQAEMRAAAAEWRALAAFAERLAEPVQGE